MEKIKSCMSLCTRHVIFNIKWKLHQKINFLRNLLNKAIKIKPWHLCQLDLNADWRKCVTDKLTNKTKQTKYTNFKYITTYLLSIHCIKNINNQI